MGQSQVDDKCVLMDNGPCEREERSVSMPAFLKNNHLWLPTAIDKYVVDDVGGLARQKTVHGYLGTV